MNTNKYPYKSVFASKISKISNTEINKYISLAGLEKLVPLMPKNVNLSENPDLIGVVSNCAVGNLVNANGDAISNKTAISLAKKFPYKFVDILHKRDRVVGVICSAGFSSFITGKLMSEKEVEESEDPVNISIAYLLYKVCLSDKFIKLLEDSTDETSSDYLSISNSWELLFNDYDICVGNKNVSESKIITDSEEKKKYEKYLLANNGSGQDEEGNLVYRLIKDDFLIPNGIGLVGSPAAEVKGLYILDETEEIQKSNKKLESSEQTNEQTNINTDISNLISHSEKIDVINNDNKEKSIPMPKITRIEDLTDENIKECRADAVRDLIENSIREASKDWEKKVQEKETLLTEAKSKYTELEVKSKESEEELKAVKEKLQTLENQILAQEKQSKFDARMEYFNDKYELDQEDREIIASDLKDVDSDDNFQKYQKKMDTLLKSKNKETLKTQRSEAKEKENQTQSQNESHASIKDGEGNQVVEAALKNGEQENGNLPNSTTSSTRETLRDKMLKAFTPENCIKDNKRK